MAPNDVGDLSGTVYDYYLEKQLLAAMYGCISVVGVVGNSAVLLAGLFSLKPRTTTAVFVFNMAVADLITCLNLPINILAVLSGPSAEDTLVSDGLCAFHGYVAVVCIGCSLNSIACVALYRALITVRGVRPRSLALFTPAGLWVMVCTSWLLPLSVGLLPVVSDYGAYGYDLQYSTCTFSPTSKGASTFSRIAIALYYPAQLIIICTSYASIFVKVRRHGRRVNPRAPAVVSGVMRLPASQGQSQVSASNDLWTNRVGERSSSGPLPPVNAPPPPPHPKNNQLSRRNLTVTLNMLLVLLCFITCITPYSLAITLSADKSQKVIPFFGMMVFFNSCVNPVIYIARHPDFKKVCRCILLCRLAEIPEKSALLRRMLVV